MAFENSVDSRIPLQSVAPAPISVAEGINNAFSMQKMQSEVTDMRRKQAQDARDDNDRNVLTEELKKIDPSDPDALDKAANAAQSRGVSPAKIIELKKDALGIKGMKLQQQATDQKMKEDLEDHVAKMPQQQLDSTLAAQQYVHEGFGHVKEIIDNAKAKNPNLSDQDLLSLGRPVAQEWVGSAVKKGILTAEQGAGIMEQYSLPTIEQGYKHSELYGNALKTRKAEMDLELTQSNINKNNAEAKEKSSNANYVSNPAVQSQIDAILDGRALLPPSTSRAPGAQAIRNAVFAADSNFDEIDNHNKVAALKSFNASSVPGQKITGINTFINHADELQGMIKDLNNKDTKIVNRAKQALSNEFGATNYSNWEVVAKEVGNEYSRILVPSGPGSEGERSAVEGLFAGVKSPDQLNEAINKARKLVAEKNVAIEQDYRTTTGRKDYYKRLTPRAREEIGMSENEKGWTLHKDKDGNYAYVSPDGKNFEVAQ